MPARAEPAGLLFVAALLLVLVALTYWTHRRRKTGPKMAFLLALIERGAAEFVDSAEKRYQSHRE